ncbi:hypothetical protein BXZ70DRAFT_201519 [Cristinia sonorae]|uniref:Metal homeostatis protein bsd2 n=1 Tax=Cristinia sonorae TaxID=1940300 RepID=A0A8K0UNR1_9AGAR|nr:hypothetical protein BXZ70DRAFT_201519 [Cristinia sonorae]
MSPSGYAPLPNPRSQPDADRELNDAFESDGEEEYDEQNHSESTPFIHSHHSPVDDERPPPQTSAPNPSAYDFERDYDHPPPGSPPGPSPFAFPNEYGNSNGLTGSTPARPTFGRPSLFRRTMGALLPQYYSRVPTDQPGTRRIGGGTDNDGVFANVMAKPSRAVQVVGEDGEVHLVPEEAQAEAPPTYREAQQDAVPSYWETTVHAPFGTGLNADMIVEDLPTGSLIIFVSNTFISFFFGFVGFLLTYLLHTSHAAKFGSRAGLGMTLIQYGIVSKNDQFIGEPDGSVYINSTTGLLEVGRPPEMVHDLGVNDTETLELANELQATHDWASLVLMTMGWMLLFLSVAGFYRVKRWEMSILSSTRAANNSVPAAAPTTTPAAEVPSSTSADPTSINLSRTFLFSSFGGVGTQAVTVPDENALRRAERDQERMARDLREAGLL